MARAAPMEASRASGGRPLLCPFFICIPKSWPEARPLSSGTHHSCGLSVLQIRREVLQRSRAGQGGPRAFRTKRKTWPHIECLLCATHWGPEKASAGSAHAEGEPAASWGGGRPQRGSRSLGPSQRPPQSPLPGQDTAQTKQSAQRHQDPRFSLLSINSTLPDSRICICTHVYTYVYEIH